MRLWILLVAQCIHSLRRKNTCENLFVDLVGWWAGKRASAFLFNSYPMPMFNQGLFAGFVATTYELLEAIMIGIIFSCFWMGCFLFSARSTHIEWEIIANIPKCFFANLFSLMIFAALYHLCSIKFESRATFPANSKDPEICENWNDGVAQQGRRISFVTISAKIICNHSCCFKQNMEFWAIFGWCNVSGMKNWIHWIILNQ